MELTKNWTRCNRRNHYRKATKHAMYCNVLLWDQDMHVYAKDFNK